MTLVDSPSPRRRTALDKWWGIHALMVGVTDRARLRRSRRALRWRSRPRRSLCHVNSLPLKPVAPVAVALEILCAVLAASRGRPAGAAPFDFAQGALDAAARGAGLAATRRRRGLTGRCPSGTG